MVVVSSNSSNLLLTDPFLFFSSDDKMVRGSKFVNEIPYVIVLHGDMKHMCLRGIINITFSAYVPKTDSAFGSHEVNL